MEDGWLLVAAQSMRGRAYNLSAIWRHNPGFMSYAIPDKTGYKPGIDCPARLFYAGTKEYSGLACGLLVLIYREIELCLLVDCNK